MIDTAAIVLGLELAPDKAAGLRTIFLILAGLLLLTVPLTLAIPDSARARRRARVQQTRPSPATTSR